MRNERVTAIEICKASTPLGLALLLAVATLLPVGDAVAAISAPHAMLVLAWYWSIHRPELLPLPGLAAVGLFQDLLWGGPPGLNMLILPAVRVVLADQETMFRNLSFAAGWAGFAAVAGLAAALAWAAGSLYYAEIMPARPMAIQGLLTIAVYPLLGWLFGRVDRWLDRSPGTWIG